MSTATTRSLPAAGTLGARPDALPSTVLRALAPRFRERVPETSSARSIPRSSVDDLKGAGAVRSLVPRAYGGLELGLREFVDLTAEAAYGCASTGWLAGQWAFAGLVVAACPREVQDTVWADGPDVVLASTAVGMTARRAPGGFVLSGKGPFASGIDHAEWLYLGAPVLEDGQPPDWRFFLLRRSQVEVLDTWHTSAMRGTGSGTVVVPDVVVPEAFSVRHSDLREGSTPGSALHPSSLYRLPWVAAVPLIYASTMLGAAQAAYDSVVTTLTGKRAPSGARAADSDQVQVQVAQAAAGVQAARTVLHALADRADSGQPYTVGERAEATRDSSFAAGLLVTAVDTALAISGTSGFGETSPVQQAWADVHFSAAHQALNVRTAGSRSARLELGVEEPVPPLFY